MAAEEATIIIHMRRTTSIIMGDRRVVTGRREDRQARMDDRRTDIHHLIIRAMEVPHGIETTVTMMRGIHAT